jgi:tRNA 5-carboxymethoxyuridine methyltransferase
MPLARVTRRLREGLRRRRELGNDADFDRVGPSFDEDLYGSSYGALRLSVVLDDLLEAIPELRSGGLSILDAGGGSGRLAVELAALGNEVVLCDPSAKMLDKAREAVDAAGLAHAVTLVQARIQDLERLDREFDLITCHVVLSWLAEPEEALGALTQRLSSGGRLSLMFVNHNAFLLHRIQRGNFSEALDDWRPDGVRPPHARKMRLSRLSHLPTGWSYAAWGARAVPLSENVVREWLDRLDFFVESKAGIRMFHDYVPESHRTPDRLEDLLTLERALRGTEPFASLGQHIHLICASRQSESQVPQEEPQRAAIARLDGARCA